MISGKSIAGVIATMLAVVIRFLTLLESIVARALGRERRDEQSLDGGPMKSREASHWQSPSIGYIMLALGTVALTALCLWHLLEAPLVGVDVSANLLPEFARARGISLAAAGSSAMAAYAHQHGGWYPLAGLEMRIWPFITTAGIPERIQLAAIALNVSTFACVCAMLTGSVAYGWASSGMTLLCFEFRKSADSFGGELLHWPLVVEFILLGALALIVAHKKPSFRFLGALGLTSCLLFLTAYDPIAYPVAIATLLVAIRSHGSTIRVAALFSVVAALGSLAINVRMNGAQWNAPSLLWNQFAGALPTVYRASGLLFKDGLSPFEGDRRFLAVPRSVLAWPAAIAVAACVFFATGLSVGRRSPFARAVVPTLGLWVATSAGVAVDHAPISFGEAVANVYVEYYCAGALLAATLISLLTRCKDARPSLSSTVIASCGLLALYIEYGNQRIDQYVIAFNRQISVRYDLLGQASRSGVFDAIPRSSQLTFATTYGFSPNNQSFDSGQAFIEATASSAPLISSVPPPRLFTTHSPAIVFVRPGKINAGTCPNLVIQRGSSVYGVFLLATPALRARLSETVERGRNHRVRSLWRFGGSVVVQPTECCT